MLTIGCVLKTGGEFTLEHVRILADSVARNAKGRDYTFRLLTDEGRDKHDRLMAAGFKIIKADKAPLAISYLRHDLPGWWSKMELFSPEVRKDWGDTLYLDLDTAITGDLTPIIDYCKTDWRDPTGGTPFTILRDFYRPQDMGSGVMFIPAEFTRPWDQWTMGGPSLTDLNIRKYGGDQNFLEAAVDGALRWQDVLPGKIASFKPVALPGATRASLPNDCRVLCFHGKPRPWELPADHWTRKYWRTNPLLVVSNDRELIYAAGQVVGDIACS